MNAFFFFFSSFLCIIAADNNREKIQKIEDIKKNIRDAILVNLFKLFFCNSNESRRSPFKIINYNIYVYNRLDSLIRLT